METYDFVSRTVFLVTLYPKIKIIQLTKYNVFTEFRKIIHNKKHELNDNIYTELNSKLMNIITNNNNHKFIIDIFCLQNQYEINNDVVISIYPNVICNIIKWFDIHLYIDIPVYSDVNSKELKTLLTINDNTDHQIILDTIMFLLIHNKMEFTRDLYVLIKNYLSNIPNKDFNNKAFFVNYHFKKLFDLKQIIKEVLDESNNMMNYTIRNLETYNLTNKKDHKLSRKIFNNINKNNYIGNHCDESVKNFVMENSNLQNEKFIDSCDFFSSQITLNNWFEELQNNNCLGLLIKYKSGQIKYTSMSFLSINDFIDMSMDQFEKNPDIQFGDIEATNIISGMTIGECNAVIPLYINNYHWKNVKLCLEPLLGIIVSHNPMLYCPNYQSLYYVLFDYLTQQLFDQNYQLNERFIKIYMAFYRTCAEICIENKYNRGIRTCVKHIIDTKQPSNINYIKLFTQIITTGCILQNQQMIDILKIYTETCNDMDLLTSLYNFYKLNQIFDIIIQKVGSYNKLLKILDEHYGLIDDDFCQMISQLITKDNRITSIDDFFDKVNITEKID